MKRLYGIMAVVVSLAGADCSGAAQAAQELQWKMLKDTGWAPADAKVKKTWDAIIKLMQDNANVPVAAWQEGPYYAFGDLRDQLPSNQQEFANRFFDVIEAANAVEFKREFLRIIDYGISSLFGSKALTDQQKQMVEQIIKVLEQKRIVVLPDRVLIKAINDLLKVIRAQFAARSGGQQGKEQKKEAEKRHVGEWGLGEDYSTQMVLLEQYVESYIAEVLSGQYDQKQLQQSFERSKNLIEGLNFVLQAEKDAAVEHMRAATPRFEQAQQQPARPAQPAGPAQRPQPAARADIETERKHIQDYIEMYTKNRTPQVFQAAATGITNSQVSDDEKEAAIEMLIALTPQEEAQPARPAAPKRAAPGRPSVSGQPQLRKVEAKQQQPAAAGRPSVVEAKVSADDNHKLHLVLEEIFATAAPGGNQAALGSVIAAAEGKINNLATLPAQRKKEIIAYIKTIPGMTELKRALERRRVMALDPLSPEAWK